MTMLFVDMGILNFIVELAKVESPVMFIGFLSIAYFCGILSGLMLMGVYQVRTVNKLMGMATKSDSPLTQLLEKAESLTGTGSSGGTPNNEQIQNMVGSVFSALGMGASADKTDDMGLSKRRKRNKAKAKIDA